MLYCAICYVALCYAALCYAMLFSAALSYTMGIGEAATFSSWLRPHLRVRTILYYTYIESPQGLLESLELHAVCEKTRLFSYGSVHGDVMWRRVRSRAVIARIAL